MVSKKQEEEVVWGAWRHSYDLIFQLLKTNMISKYKGDYETCLDCIEDLEMMVPLSQRQSEFDELLNSAQRKLNQNSQQEDNYMGPGKVQPSREIKRLTKIITKRMHELGMFVPIRKLNDDFDPDDFASKSDLA